MNGRGVHRDEVGSTSAGFLDKLDECCGVTGMPALRVFCMTFLMS